MLNSEIEASLKLLKINSKKQRQLSTSIKNAVLLSLSEKLKFQEPGLLAANEIDLKKLPQTAAPAFRDRLTLNSARLADIRESLRQVAALEDPVGEIIEENRLVNGLRTQRVRSPLGIIFMIFESRPNVILEAFSLAFKSGNSIILRGGSDSSMTANCIYQIMAQTLDEHGLTDTAFYGLKNYDHAVVEDLLKRKDLIDIVIPRGGEKLIEYVQRTALMPIIKNDRGLCHTYVDEDADLVMAKNIVINAKTQRPGVCNSLETVLVHQKIAVRFITDLYEATESFQLIWYGDQQTLKILHQKQRVHPATDKNWDTEYLDLIINCRVVESLAQALQHIEKHSSKHSEAIVTSSEQKAHLFQSEVDAAVVFWNASTRFTDGYQLGLGGELGISTQKLHVRGPVGLRELTTARWIISGTGQIRGS